MVIPDNLVSEPKDVNEAYEQHVEVKKLIKWLEAKNDKLKNIMKGFADTIDTKSGLESIPVDLGDGKMYTKQRVVKKREIDYDFAHQVAENKKLNKLFSFSQRINKNYETELVDFLKVTEPSFLEEIEEIDDYQFEQYIQEGKITNDEIKGIIKEVIEWRLMTGKEK